jgi:ligand-binding SRPBCC domain-containing protein
MALITPPPIIVQMINAPIRLEEGDIVEFTLWMLLLPLHWKAKILNISQNGFVDEHLSGPFEFWKHQHTFNQVNETTTAIVDTVEYLLKRNVFWNLIGRAMGISLPFLFRLRAWKTNRILTKTM